MTCVKICLSALDGSSAVLGWDQQGESKFANLQSQNMSNETDMYTFAGWI